MRIISDCRPEAGEVLDHAKKVYCRHIDVPVHTEAYIKDQRRFIIRTYSPKIFPGGKIIILETTDVHGIGVGGSCSARLKTVTTGVVATQFDSSSVTAKVYSCSTSVGIGTQSITIKKQKYESSTVVAITGGYISTRNHKYSSTGSVAVVGKISSWTKGIYPDNAIIAVYSESSAIKKFGYLSAVSIASKGSSQTFAGVICITYGSVALAAESVSISSKVYSSEAILATDIESNNSFSLVHDSRADIAIQGKLECWTQEIYESTAIIAIDYKSYSKWAMNCTDNTVVAITGGYISTRNHKYSSTGSVAVAGKISSWTKDIYPDNATIAVYAESSAIKKFGYLSDVSIASKGLSQTFAGAICITYGSVALAAESVSISSKVYSSKAIVATEIESNNSFSLAYNCTDNTAFAINGSSSSYRSICYRTTSSIATTGNSIIHKTNRYIDTGLLSVTGTSSVKRQVSFTDESKIAVSASSVTIKKLHPTIQITADYWDEEGSDTPMVTGAVHGDDSNDPLKVGSTGHISAIASSGGMITYTSSAPSVARIDPVTGDIVIMSLSGSVTFTISVAETADYYSSSVTGGLHVFQRFIPTITWPNPNTLEYPNPLSVFCNRVRGLNIYGVFVFSLDGINPLDETIVLPVADNDNVALSYKYTPYDTDNYRVVTDGGWLQMIKGNLTVISGGSDITVKQGSHASGSVLLSNGTLAKLQVYQIGVMLVLSPSKTLWTEAYTGTSGGATCTVVYTSQPDPNYNDLVGSFRVTIDTKLSQTISPITVTGAINNRGGGTGTLYATASSGLPVIFSCTSTSAYIAGNTIVCTTPGVYQIKANQSGNADYLAAPTVYYSLTVRYTAVYFTVVNGPSIVNSRLNFNGGSGSYTWSYNGQPNNISIRSNAGWNDSTYLYVLSYSLPACYPPDTYYRIVDNNDPTNSATIYGSQWFPLMNSNIGECQSDPGGGGGTIDTGLVGQWDATLYFTQIEDYFRNVRMMLFSDGTGGYESSDFWEGTNAGDDYGDLTWSTVNGYLTISSKVGTTLFASPWVITSKWMVGGNTTYTPVTWTSMTGIPSYPEDWGEGDLVKS